jgi:hypothetical protein
MTGSPAIPSEQLGGTHAMLRHALERSHNVACLLDRDLTLIYCNPAWNVFAMANDGEAALAEKVVGRNLLDFATEPVKTLYEQLFAAARASGTVWPFRFECSSREVIRWHRMEAFPLDEDCFAVVYACVQGEPRVDEGTPANASLYVGPGGLITMCSNCRKTRRQSELAVWDWVPEHFELKYRLRTSHGICSSCWAFYYPQVYRDVVIKAGSGAT